MLQTTNAASVCKNQSNNILMTHSFRGCRNRKRNLSLLPDIIYPSSLIFSAAKYISSYSIGLQSLHCAFRVYKQIESSEGYEYTVSVQYSVGIDQSYWSWLINNYQLDRRKYFLYAEKLWYRNVMANFNIL